VVAGVVIGILYLRIKGSPLSSTATAPTTDTGTGTTTTDTGSGTTTDQTSADQTALANALGAATAAIQAQQAAALAAIQAATTTQPAGATLPPGTGPQGAPMGTEAQQSAAAQAADLAQQPADVAAAEATLSPTDAAYWSAKLAASGGIGNTVNTYNPATLLARWLQQAAAGPAGTALTQQDITSGLAYARARAVAAGVTQAQLAAAQAGIAGPEGGWYGVEQPGDQATIDALSQVGMLGKQLTAEQQSAINAAGGFTPTNILKVLGPTMSTGATAADANAARISKLQAAIATTTKNVAVNTKAGKTGPGSAGVTDAATLAAEKSELAKLTGK